jgi:hypothetical protein
MTKKTLVWVVVFTVMAAFCSWHMFLARSNHFAEPRTADITELQTHPTQASVPDSRMKNREVDQAMQNADKLLERVTDVRRRIRDGQTQEDRDKRSRYKIERYQSLFESWSLASEQVTDSLQLLANRDKELAEIDNRMLDRQIPPHVAAKEKNERRLDALDKLSDIIGPEMSAKFGAWDNPPRSKK